MKTKIISVFVIAFSLIACAVFAGNNKSVIKNNQIRKFHEEPVYFQIVVETIFQEGEREKIDKLLVDNYAPFVITSVDYKLKTLEIKVFRKCPFDEVKQGFDKVGLRIMKETELKK